MALRLRADVSTADTEYGTVLLDERNGDYWQLNPTGAFVVRVLLDGGSTEQAATALSEHYEVEESQALLDVTTLVDQLRTARLMTP